MKVNLEKGKNSYRIELEPETEEEINFINEFNKFKYNLNTKERIFDNRNKKLIIKRYRV